MVDTEFYRGWLQRRLQIADTVANQGCQADAEILLCCALSGLAALAWPGKRIDTVRFVQLLVNFAPPEAGLKLVSVPRLRAALAAEGDWESATKLAAEFDLLEDGGQLMRKDLDRDEQVLVALLPHLNLTTIRNSSYAAVLYVDLRCALVHEYELSGQLTAFSWPSKKNALGYYCVIDPETEEMEWLLHLPYSWVRSVISATGDALIQTWGTAKDEALEYPQQWWIKGDTAQQKKSMKRSGRRSLAGLGDRGY